MNDKGSRSVQDPSRPTPRFPTLPVVLEVTGLAPATVYRTVADHSFPRRSEWPSGRWPGGSGAKLAGRLLSERCDASGSDLVPMNFGRNPSRDVDESAPKLM